MVVVGKSGNFELGIVGELVSVMLGIGVGVDVMIKW